MIPIYKPYMPEDITSEIEDILYSGKLSYGDKEKSLKKNWHHTLEMIKC